MKKLLLLSLLLSGYSIGNSEEVVEEPCYIISSEEPDAQTRQGDCSFATQIINISTAENAQNRPNAVSVPAEAITEPGLYCLSNSIQSSSNRIIRIQTNDVTLDLNGQQLETSGNNIAIFIQGGLRNIVILNGSIRGGFGISATNVRELRIVNVRFINNRRAVTINGDRDLILSDCQAESPSVNGYQISDVTNGIIIACRTAGGTSTSSGFLLSNLDSFVIQESQGNNNAQGFNCLGCRNMVFSACHANNNRGSGFRLVDNPSGANANNKILESTAQGNRLIGFELEGTSHSIEGSCALFNSSHGFSIKGFNHTLLNNIAKRNRSNGFIFEGNGHSSELGSSIDNMLDGFSIAGINHTLLNNIAKRNRTGFILLSGSGFCQVRSNTATSNGAFGFFNAVPPAFATPNRIYSNFANNNGTNYNLANIPNVAVSPVPATPINFTTNIAE